MAKRTVTTVTTEKSDQELDLNQRPAAGESDDDGEVSVIDELLGMDGASEYKFKVEKVAPAAEAGHCATYNGSELTLERIRDEFGPGRYQLTTFNSKGQYVSGGRRQLSIAKVLNAQDADRHERLGVREILDVIRANQSPRDESATQMMQIFLKQSEMQQAQMTALLTAVLTRPADKPADPLQMIAALKDIMAPTNQSGGSDKAVEMLLKGITLGKEFNGTGGGDWTDALIKGLDVAAPIFQQAAEARPAPQPQQAHVVRPAVQHNPQVQSQPQQAGVDPMLQKLQWVKRQVAALLIQAQNGKKPALYAELFVDQLPPFLTREEVKAQFSDPNAVDTLAQLDERVLQHRQWFDTFRAKVLLLLTQQEPKPAPPSEPLVVPMTGFQPMNYTPKADEEFNETNKSEGE